MKINQEMAHQPIIFLHFTQSNKENENLAHTYMGVSPQVLYRIYASIGRDF